MNPIDQLVRQFGETAVREWLLRAAIVQEMTVGAMRAISEGAGKPVAPEILAVVLQYPMADGVDPLVVSTGVGAEGAIDTAGKRALLVRAVVCLDEGDKLQVVDTPKPARKPLVIIPGGGG